ncbi:MAG TPA: hypothetical protein VKA21_04375 [Candidatus Binatia bacterium]|nr:hypothetical protein [Candidatus Binatia bacterium]
MSRAAIVLAAVLAVACKGPSVPHPATGETRYTCCNMHYEKNEITDANYLKGTLIPLGTRVQIVEVRRNSVKFQAQGHPPITLFLRHGKDVIGMDQYLDRVFVRDDPHARLPRAEAPRPVKGKKGGGDGGGKQAAEAERVRKLIEQGVVEPGMTRDQVILALGYPPVHRTPSLDSPMWTYWANRWATFEVYFDGDRVSRVNR